MNTPRLTPETDNAQWSTGKVKQDFARRLVLKRNKARDQLEAMREAIEDVNKILLSIQRNDIFEETMRNHATCALTKLQPFINQNDH